ncbi:DUF4114 domain-containing protein, partial [uncultured Nostoc sp.]|uniref:DUF4114 domain-containing protein n=1 Tax=uncultured Nostoc sp. TaxID=340711 RepID=UPI0035CADE54
TVGDFNGDGKLDLAAANLNSNNVSVLLGNGTGGFGTATNFSVGTAPRSVTVGDFNGDGKLDLAAANLTSNNVSVLLNANPSATLTIVEPVAPVTTATNTALAYSENDPATIIDPGITVTDADSTSLSSATVTITNGFVATEDTLAFTNQNGITGTYTNGVLTLTGSATVADYQTALQSVTYQNSSDNPSTTPRTISFVVNDGNLDSTPATRDIDLTPVNDAPVITATNTALAYTENDPATIIDSGITVTDADSNSLSSATVTITNGFVATEDTLAFTNQNGITGTYTNGVLTLTGSATVADYQTALQSVTYQNSSDNPSTTPRTISFVVNDGNLDSTPATRDIDLTPVNDAPVITATNTALAYTENDPATIIDSGITVTDADSNSLSSATVTITNGFVATEDTLAFTNQNGITGTYTNGVLTLTGSATVADYQTALQSVTYQNSSDNPTTNRTISFVVNDGSLDSTPVTRDINLTAVNDAPTDLELSANTINDEAPANTAIGTFSSTDPDQKDNFAYSLVSGIDDVDNNAFTIDGNSLKINNSPDFKTKSSYKIRVRTTDNGNFTFEKGLTINVNNATEIPNRLTNPNDDVFNIKGKDVKLKLEIKLTGHSSKLVNELGLFTVDDTKGIIDGIAPGAEGYAKAALKRSKVILSAIANTPNGFDYNNLSSLLELNSGDNFRFLLVIDSTLDAVRNDPNSIRKLLFSGVSTQITALNDDSFSLGWKDVSNNTATDFNDLVVKVKQTNQALPIGTNLQDKFLGEVIDLRDIKQSVKAEFNVYREASYNNYVGFYQVTDANGGIDTNGDGIADVLTGQAGYIQAAVRGKIAGIDLSVSNQGSATYTGTFQPGAIFAPFIIVNGRPDALLDNNSNNDPAVYFPFLGANSDKSDHIRLLANNTFGFEDLPSGGDRDFNDVIIKANLTATV